MRRLLCLAVGVVAMLAAMVGCSYNDEKIWNKFTELEQDVDKNREDIATHTALVDALSSGKVIVATESTDEGVLLTFSDGSTILIRHGADGEDGTNGEDGLDGDSMFESIEESETEVVITLTDGRVIRLPKSVNGENEGGDDGADGLTYELRILTFEDAEAAFSPYELGYCGRTIATWSDLIAEDQYMSSLIYDMSGAEPYYWYDQGNTELCHAFPYNYGSYAYWGGGHAVSNYANLDYAQYGDYMNQLTVYGEDGAGGHDGSANFCMHFGYKDDSGYNGTEELPSIMFADGVARVVDHMWVNNSCYALNCYYNGNGLTAPIADGDRAWVIATGYGADDESVGQAIFYLADGPDAVVAEWTKWDLSPLGEVVRIEFNLAGTSDNGYGFSQPAYFAYDDVAVRFEI